MIRGIVNRFYDIMDGDSEAAHSRALHAHDFPAVRGGRRVAAFMSTRLVAADMCCVSGKPIRTAHDLMK
jgi:hypothetical protein